MQMWAIRTHGLYAFTSTRTCNNGRSLRRTLAINILDTAITIGKLASKHFTANSLVGCGEKTCQCVHAVFHHLQLGPAQEQTMKLQCAMHDNERKAYHLH